MVMQPGEQKRLIQAGYDRIAEAYLKWEDGKPSRMRIAFTQFVIDTLEAGAEVLDLGCGSGVPTAQLFAETFTVTGVDFSESQIALARQHVPQATFIHADITEVKLPYDHFDAVIAFYSIIHVPRVQQPHLYSRITRWLKPGGLFVASMGSRDEVLGYEEDWLGAPMAWSSFDPETSQRLIRESGLDVLKTEQETVVEDGKPQTFLWVIARKPPA